MVAIAIIPATWEMEIGSWFKTSLGKMTLSQKTSPDWGHVSSGRAPVC
jgi:hypothetical protein